MSKKRIGTRRKSKGQKSLKTIKDFQPDRLNANKGTPRGLQMVEDSLRKYGAGRSILADRHGRIIAGNKTLQSASDINLPIRVVETDGKELVVVQRTDLDLTDAKARELAIADNRSSQVGLDWDVEVLSQLKDEGVELSGMFTERELALLLPSNGNGDAPEPQIDRAAELQEKWGVKRGQIWQVGRHRLMCGDATETGDMEALLDGKRISLTFTSPPYNDLREYGGASNLDPTVLARFIPAWAEHSELLAVNLGLIVRNGEVLRYWDVYLETAANAGLKLLSWNVWNREDATSVAAQRMMFPLWHEWVFVFGAVARESNQILPTNNAGKMASRRQRLEDGGFTEARKSLVADKKRLGTVLTTPSYKGGGFGNHPAIFPVTVPTAYIEAVTQQSEVIADPFVGSGTTICAAETLNRTCYAMEISPEYCSVVLERMEQAFRLTGKVVERVDARAVA